MAVKQKGCKNPELRRRVRVAYTKGEKVADICDRFDIPKSTVYNWVKANRVGPKGKGRWQRRYTPGVKDQIATLNYRGLSDGQIAKRLGLGHEWTRQERIRMGLPGKKQMKGNG